MALLGLIAYCGDHRDRGCARHRGSIQRACCSRCGVAFSGYLLWAQLGPIGAICQWCLGNDIVISVVAVLCVVRMLTEPQHVERKDP